MSIVETKIVTTILDVIVSTVEMSIPFINKQLSQLEAYTSLTHVTWQNFKTSFACSCIS